MQKAHKQIFFFFGNDEFTVKEKAKALIAKLALSKGENEGLESLDGGTTSMEEILITLQTPPLFTAHKVIWVKNLKSLEKASAQGANDLIALLRLGLPKENILLLTHTKIDQRLKIISELKKISDWEELSSGEEWFNEKANEILKNAKKTITSAAMELIREFTSEHPEAFTHELEKIITYVGSKKSNIEARDVLSIASSYGEEPFFQFVDQVLSKKGSASIKTLRQLILQGENPIGLVNHLLNSLRLLIEVRSLIEGGFLHENKIPATYHKDRVYSTLQLLPPNIVAAFPSQANPLKQHPYRIYILLRQSLNFKLNDLRSLFLKAVKTYWELVNSKSPTDALEKIVFEINPSRVT